MISTPKRVVAVPLVCVDCGNGDWREFGYRAEGHTDIGIPRKLLARCLNCGHAHLFPAVEFLWRGKQGYLRWQFVIILLTFSFAACSRSPFDQQHRRAEVVLDRTASLYGSRLPACEGRKNYQRLFYRYREIAAKIGLHEWSAF
jgi:hypothetical protein